MSTATASCILRLDVTDRIEMYAEQIHESGRRWTRRATGGLRG